MVFLDFEAPIFKGLRELFLLPGTLEEQGASISGKVPLGVGKKLVKWCQCTGRDDCGRLWWQCFDPCRVDCCGDVSLMQNCSEEGAFSLIGICKGKGQAGLAFTCKYGADEAGETAAGANIQP